MHRDWRIFLLGAITGVAWSVTVAAAVLVARVLL